MGRTGRGRRHPRLDREHVPHPRNPAGRLPVEVAQRTYGTLLANHDFTYWNYLSFRYTLLWLLACWRWEKRSEFIRDGKVVPGLVEGLNLADSRKIKDAVGVPVLCTGGFQHAERIVRAIEGGDCDGVTMARTLLANPDLPNLLREGRPGPDRDCTYCNKCLLYVIDHPLGCYDESRFTSYDEMMERLMDFYQDETEVPPVRSSPESSRGCNVGRSRRPSHRAFERTQDDPAASKMTFAGGARCSTSRPSGTGRPASCFTSRTRDQRLLHDDTQTDPVYRDLFLSSAVVFGIGFWMVGNDPSRRPDVGALGDPAQLCVFQVLAYSLAIGRIHALQAIPGSSTWSSPSFSSNSSQRSAELPGPWIEPLQRAPRRSPPPVSVLWFTNILPSRYRHLAVVACCLGRVSPAYRAIDRPVGACPSHWPATCHLTRPCPSRQRCSTG